MFYLIKVLSTSLRKSIYSAYPPRLSLVLGINRPVCAFRICPSGSGVFRTSNLFFLVSRGQNENGWSVSVEILPDLWLDPSFTSR